MSLVIGLGNILIGLAYAGLGSLSAWETISLHRYRGWSRFGIGFSLMAASCGPHHLVHGWHVLMGEGISYPMFAATLIGLPAGLMFVLLRFETIWGGQGDRWVSASPHQAVLLAAVFTIVAGCMAAWMLAQAVAGTAFEELCTSSGVLNRVGDSGSPMDLTSVTFLANMFVTITYGLVGCYLADHQVRCYLTNGVWSLSGVALTGVFFSCAQMHFIDATTRGNDVMIVFDLIGIPASVYFLWVVKQVHNDSAVDWNRRPLVGAAAAPARPSPWSAGRAQH
jgi:hypothetical protein